MTRKSNVVGILGQIATLKARLAMPGANLCTAASIGAVLHATRPVGRAAKGYLPAMVAAGGSVAEPVARSFDFSCGVTERAQRRRW